MGWQWSERGQDTGSPLSENRVVSAQPLDPKASDPSHGLQLLPSREQATWAQESSKTNPRAPTPLHRHRDEASVEKGMHFKQKHEKSEILTLKLQ